MRVRMPSFLYVYMRGLIRSCICIHNCNKICIRNGGKMCIKIMSQIFCLAASLRSHGWPAPFAYVLWQIVCVIACVCVSALIWNCNFFTVRIRNNFIITICVNMCIAAICGSVFFSWFFFSVSMRVRTSLFLYVYMRFWFAASLRSHGWPAPFAYVLWQIVYLIVYVCVSALIWNCNCITVRNNFTIRICVNMCITDLWTSVSLHARPYAIVSVRVYARFDPELYLHTQL